MTRINSTNLFGITQYIVDPSPSEGSFTTVQSAMDALNLAGNDGYIFIRPGSYAENLIIYPNQQIVGASDEGRISGANPVTIIGTHTLQGDGAGGQFAATIFESIFFQSLSDTFTVLSDGPNGILLVLKFCSVVSAAGNTVFLDVVGGGSFALGVIFETNLTAFSSGFFINGVGCAAQALLGEINSQNGPGVSLFGANSNFSSQYSQIAGNLSAIEIFNPTNGISTDFSILSTNNGPTILFTGAGSANCFNTTHNANGGPGFYVTGTGNYSYCNDVLNGGRDQIDPLVSQTNRMWRPTAITTVSSTDARRGTCSFDATQFTSTDGYIQLVGGGGTYLSLSPYIVGQIGDTHAGFTSINAAIGQAVADGHTGTNPANVYIKPGTYVENVIMFPGINLVGFSSGFNASFLDPSLIPGTEISGLLTASYGGQATIQNITLTANATNAISINGAPVLPTVLTLTDCFLTATNGTTILYASNNAVVSFWNCNIAQEGGFSFFNKSGSSEINFYQCVFDSLTGSVSNNACSDGQVRLDYCGIGTGIILTGTGRLQARHSNFGDPTGLAIDQSSLNTTNLEYCNISNSVGPSVNIAGGSLLQLTACTVSAAASPEITGLGTIEYDHLFDTNAIAGTVTQVVQTVLPISGTTVFSRGHAYFDPTQFTVDPDGQVHTTGAPLTWSDHAGSVVVGSNTGSFFLPAGVVLTLPTAPLEGTVCDFAVTNGASPGVIQAGGADSIRIGSSVSGVAGTATSSASGDSIHLVYRAGDATWYSVGAGQGTWLLV